MADLVSCVRITNLEESQHPELLAVIISLDSIRMRRLKGQMQRCVTIRVCRIASAGLDED